MSSIFMSTISLSLNIAFDIRFSEGIIIPYPYHQYFHYNLTSTTPYARKDAISHLLTYAILLKWNEFFLINIPLVIITNLFLKLVLI